MRKLAIYFLVAVTGGIAATLLNIFIQGKNAPAAVAANTPIAGTTVNYSGLPNGLTPDFSAAAERTVHGVVHVKTKYTSQHTYYDPFQGWFFGHSCMQVVPREEQSSGSGVILTNDGYIVTNFHVIQKAEQIEVVLNDNRTYPATLIGADPNTDLAVLKVDEKNLPFIAYGNSDQVKIGEWVLAVGNPFNLTSTVTAGIVSAKARNINIIQGNGSGAGAIESFIQTDAAVNPGNSGGALVNTSGELVGINTAIASSTGAFSGYSFAIPVNLVRKVVADIIEFGTVQRGYLGVNIRSVDAALSKEKNLKAVKGVYVDGVVAGGAAEDAGITTGDVISRVGDIEVNSVPELQEQINRFRPGDKVSISYRRGDKEKVAQVILKNKNNSTSVIRGEEKAEGSTSLGANFEALPGEELKRLNVTSGVKVSGLTTGKLRSAGIRDGFIITHVDKKAVSSAEELKNTLESKKGGVLIEGIYPNGMRAYYAFGM